MNRLRDISLWLIAAAFANAAVPTAAPGQMPADDLVSAELISDVASIQPGRPFTVALRLTMREGWHVNWLNPGDAGLAPTVVWTLPRAFEADDIQWPYPDRFDLPGVSIFGYGGEVLLLTDITPATDLPAGHAVDIKAKVNWLACREACVPGGADLALRLPVSAAAPASEARWRKPFEEARAMLPTADNGWRFRAKLSGNHIRILAYPPESHAADLAGVTFFPSVPGVIDNSAPQTIHKAAGYYRVDIERSRIGDEAPQRIRGVLVSQSGWGAGTTKAIEIDVPVQ